MIYAGNRASLGFLEVFDTLIIVQLFSNLLNIYYYLPMKLKSDDDDDEQNCFYIFLFFIIKGCICIGLLWLAWIRNIHFISILDIEGGGGAY